MSAYVTNLLAQAEQIKAERAEAQANETLAEAHAALDEALEKYSAYPCSRNAYAAAEAKDRVEAAKVRENKPIAQLQSLAEWAATEGGQEFMDQAPDSDLLVEIGEHNRARVAPRHPNQPYYQTWRMVPQA